MKLKWMIAGSFLAGVLSLSCSQTDTNKKVGDTIQTPLIDTVSEPTQGYGPDMSTTQVPDTLPDKDSTKR